MKIEGCEFPDDLLYDEDALTWARVERTGTVLVGITSIHASLAGRLVQVKAKPTGVAYERRRAIATVEGGKYFGAVRTPLDGLLVEVNEAVLRRPKTLSESPYEDGWLARLRPDRLEDDRRLLRTAAEAAGTFARQIADLRIRCFAAFPDHEMVEIGTECAAVLSKLNELLGKIAVGEVVHLVSDDWTAPAVMANWSEQSKQPVVESRKEGELYHFLVRKVS